MEQEYDKLIELQTRGELQGISKIEKDIDAAITAATYVCSKGLADEVKIRNAKVSWQKKKSNKNADAKTRASPSRADEKAPKKKKEK